MKMIRSNNILTISCTVYKMEREKEKYLKSQ